MALVNLTRTSTRSDAYQGHDLIEAVKYVGTIVISRTIEIELLPPASCRWSTRGWRVDVRFATSQGRRVYRIPKGPVGNYELLYSRIDNNPNETTIIICS
jgi:hypothetical protein